MLRAMGVSLRKLAPLWALALALACAQHTGQVQHGPSELSSEYLPGLPPVPQGPGGEPLHAVTILPPPKAIPVVRALNPAHNGRVCSTWGDFHYKTFDGDVFRFPGLCNYVFSSHCGAAYEDFDVQLRRGQGSAPSKVVMKLDGMVVELTQSSVLVNGHHVQLPFSQSGVLIEHSSSYVKVVARLGLVFMWNQDNSLLLELDSKYANQTCGLCGDFNGVPGSEFLSHNVKLTPIEFGNLQKMDGPTEQCQDPAPEPQKNCSTGFDICEEVLGSPLFFDCAALVHPGSYIEACRQDLCLCQLADLASCVCHTLAEYSRQCAHAGGLPGDWRGPDLCPQTCPHNMQYRECHSPCADTCSNLEHSQVCEDHCVSGCFCPEGMVFDDIGQTGCVPVSQCACVYNGATYAPGAVYSTDCSQCTCSGGRWNCQEAPCPGTCSVLGGAHFSTFDEREYTVHGDCSYVLAKPCNSSAFTVLAELRRCGLTDSETCLKSVTLSLDGGQTVVVVKASGEVFVNQIYTQLPISAANVTLFRPSTFFVIAQTSLGLQLDIQLVPTMQVFVRLAPALRGLTCGLCGNFNSIQTDDFRTISGVVEGTAAAFFNTFKTQAACPNVKNTFEDPCALSVENEKYAQHWCSRLTDADSPFAPCHTAVNPSTYYSNCMFDTCNCEKSEDCLCAALSAYVHACAAKGVLLRGWRDGVCSECAAQPGTPSQCGVSHIGCLGFPGWRDGVCTKPLSTCPKSMTYSYHISSCQPTCRALGGEDATCHISFVPVDGCTCPEGTFLDDLGKCVPASSCPCYHRDSVVPNGESVHDGSAVCTCTQGKLTCIGGPVPTPVCAAPMVYFDCRNATPGATGAGCQKSCHTLDMACYATRCVPGCVCPDGLVSDGEGGCIAVEDCPCVHNEASYQAGQTIRVGCNTCTCEDRMWQCTDEPCMASCAVYGDGHYVTFDGQRYSFSGDCEYTLVQDHCGGNGSTPDAFRVVTENVPCGTTGTTCSKAIKIFLGSSELKLSDGKVEVIEKGTGQEVPYSIRQMGIYLVVDTDAGLLLQWDRKTSIVIRLSPELKGRVCGLCGNFDGNAINDFTTRSQSVVGSVLEFGNSWKFSPSCPDARVPRDPCTANPYRKSWAQKQCSIINSATFAACHAHVEPTKYYEACVSDACACDSGGDCECFCTAVAAYAQACQEAGVCVSWRTPDVCPLFCDYYNPEGQCQWHYQPCGAPCMRTCRNPRGQCLHDVHGLEGCYPKCPAEAPIFDEDKMQCVAKCPVPPPTPCYVHGKAYRPGTSVPSDKNCQSCVCTESGVRCTYDAGACVCTYDGQHFSPGDIIYHTTDGTGACISARCGANGTIDRSVQDCSSSTPMPPTTFFFSTSLFVESSTHPPSTGLSPTQSTVHTATPTAPATPSTTVGTSPRTKPARTSTPPQPACGEECRWSPWLDISRPGQGIDSGDFDTLDNLRAHGYPICQAPKAVECRAEDAPDVPLRVRGQRVECSPTVGLTCHNRDQVSGLCDNYQIRVLCCTPLACPTASSPTQTTSLAASRTATTGTMTSRPPTASTAPVTTTGPATLSVASTPVTVSTPPAPGTSSPSPHTFPPSPGTLPPVPETPLPTPGTPHPPPGTSPPIPGTTTSIKTTPLTPRTTPVPQTTSTAHSVSTVATGTSGVPGESTAPEPSKISCLQDQCSWTEWMDGSYPGPGRDSGDFDTFHNLRAKGYSFCENPKRVQCRAQYFPDVPLAELGQTVTCNSKEGLICLNKDQLPPICYNYEIRIQCCHVVDVCRSPPTPREDSTTPRTTWTTQHMTASSATAPTAPSTAHRTPPGSSPATPHCQPQCRWTKWFDVDFPAPGPQGGDQETYSNIIRSGERICHRPEEITRLQCRAESHPEVSIETLGQVVRCDRDVGLECRNHDQPGPFQMCLNYEVRVLCCETPKGCTTPVPVTVPSTQGTGTAAVHTTSTISTPKPSPSVVPKTSTTSMSTTSTAPISTTSATTAPTTSTMPVSTTSTTHIATTSTTIIPTTSATPIPTTSATPLPTTNSTPITTTNTTPIPTTSATPIPSTSTTPIPTTSATPIPTTSTTTIPTTRATSIIPTSSTLVPTTSPTPIPTTSSTPITPTSSTPVPTTSPTPIPATSTTPIPATSTTPIPVTTTPVPATSTTPIPVTTTSIPATSKTPFPVTTTPIPATSTTPIPVTTTPVPATSTTPIPVTTTSIPATSTTPIPVTTTPIPVTTTPIPATSTTPIPVTTTPIPATTKTPIPVTTSPIPATSTTPIPVTTTPIPATTKTPIPVTTTPIPETTTTPIPATSTTPIPATSTTPIPATSTTPIPTTSTTPIPATSTTPVPKTNTTFIPSTSASPIPTTSTSHVPTPETTQSTSMTPHCQPQCRWTKWFDVDFPAPGPQGGDQETYSNIIRSGERICHRPEEITRLECRAESHPEVSIETLGQVVRCDRDVGLECRNHDQLGPFQMCLNYEVRVLCCETPKGCTTPVPVTVPSTQGTGTAAVHTTSTISTPKPSPSVVPKTSTTSMSTTSSTHAKPTSTTPIPTTSATTIPTTSATPIPTTSATTIPTTSATPIPTTSTTTIPTTSSTPIPTTSSTPIPTTSSTPIPTTSSTPIPTTSSTPIPTTSSTPIPTTSTSHVPTPETTQSTSMTPHCQPQCRWTKWFDVDFPAPGPQGGDQETYSNIIRSGERICHRPEEITRLQCRAESHPEVSIETLGQVVRCDRDVGLECRNHDQPGPFQMCLNYEVRVLCCETPKGCTTPVPVTVPSTQGTGTAAVHTTSTISTPKPSPSVVPKTSTTFVPTTSSTHAKPTSTTPITTTSATSTPTTSTTPIPTTSATTIPTTSTTPIPTTSATPIPTTSTTTIPTTSATTIPTTSATPIPTTSATPIPTTSATPIPTTSATPIPTTSTTPIPTTSATPIPTTSPTPISTTSSTPIPTTSTSHVPTPETTQSTSMTPHCQPQCRWTKWFDVDFPAPGPQGGDQETYSNIIRSGERICHRPEEITRLECRAESHPEVSIETLGQVVRCDRDVGLECRNHDQLGPFQMCLNYEVRVLCCETPKGCTTPVPVTVPSTQGTGTAAVHTTSTISTPKPSPSVVPKTSTTSMSTTSSTHAKPTSTTPIPTTSATTIPTTSATPIPTTSATTIPTTSATPIPTTSTTTIPTTSATPIPTTSSTPIPTTSSNPIPTTSSTPIPTTSSTPIPTTSSTPIPATSTSHVPTPETTQSTPMTPHCQPQCRWTKWFDVDFPAPGPQGGDQETYSNIIRSGERICHRPEEITRLECRAESHPEVSIETLGQVVRCDRDVGLECRNHDQPGPFQMCLNYEVRVLCCEPADADCPLTSVPPYATSTITAHPAPSTSVISTSSASSVAHPTQTCFCSVRGQLFPAGSIIYNQTDLSGHCFYALCTHDCQVVREVDRDCPSTTPPPASATSLSMSTSAHVTKQGCPNAVPPRKLGETWPMPNCSQATCEGDHVISLQPRKCPQVKKPTCANGYPALKVADQDGCCHHYQCQCVCSGWGDPHYITFDGVYYTFLDNCTYVLVQQIVPVYGHFRVLVNNYFCTAEDGLSCPQAIIVEYQQDQVVLTSKLVGGVTTNQIIFNNEVVRPGFRKNGIVTSRVGIKMYVTIPEIGVQVMFTGLIFSVEVPFSKFANNTEGQCGTCTNDRQDECRLPGGTLASSCSEMSGFWNVTVPGQPSCHRPPQTPTTVRPTTSPAPCPESSVCQLILSDVFELCHAVIPPWQFYEGCVFDQCHVADAGLACSSLQLYASLCAWYGVCIDWRGRTNGTCLFSCPADKVYQPCGPTSPAYCYGNDSASLVSLEEAGPITEGCFCPEGTVPFSSDVEVCVPVDCPRCLGPHGEPVEPGHTISIDCQECTCEGSTRTLACRRKACPLPPACPLPGFVPVPAAPQADQCCPQYSCACNVSYCPKPVDCPSGSRQTLTYEEGACCPSQNCSLVGCHVNGTLYQPGAVVSSDLCETCRCEVPGGPQLDTFVVSCETQICNTHCPVGFEYQVQSGQCCGTCVQVACVTNSSGSPAHLFYPGETWTDPGNHCVTHECEKHQDGLVVVTVKKSCPPLRCPPDQAELSEDGCCLSCRPSYNRSTCAVHYKNQIIRQWGCSSARPVPLAYCQGNCGDTASMYSLEASMMKHSCRCCQELRTSLRNVTLQCADGSSRAFSYTQVEECSCQGLRCHSEEPGSEQSEEDQSQETERRVRGRGPQPPQ